jgi:hypothetical protein
MNVAWARQPAVALFILRERELGFKKENIFETIRSRAESEETNSGNAKIKTQPIPHKIL